MNPVFSRGRGIIISQMSRARCHLGADSTCDRSTYTCVLLFLNRGEINYYARAHAQVVNEKRQQRLLYTLASAIFTGNIHGEERSRKSPLSLAIEFGLLYKSIHRAYRSRVRVSDQLAGLYHLRATRHGKIREYTAASGMRNISKYNITAIWNKVISGINCWIISMQGRGIRRDKPSMIVSLCKVD